MTYQADVLVLSPTVFLPMDDAAAGAAHALAGSGTAITGLNFNQSSFIGGDLSAAAGYTGSGGGRYTAAGLSFAGQQPYTLLVWCQPTSLDTSTDRRIFSKEDPASGTATDGYALIARSNKFFMQRTIGGIQTSQSTGVGMSVGDPHMVVWTFDGTRSRLYLDGSKLFDAVHGDAGLPATTDAMTIGTRSNAGLGYAGLMKDFAAWDGVVLTDAQVLSLYQSGMSGRSPLAVLKGGYRRPGLPVGAVNVNNQVFRSPDAYLAQVKVFEQDTTLRRVMLPFNCENTSFQPKTGPTRTDYGRGDGGILRVRLCTLNADGTPNLSTVLAQETNVAAATRYPATQTLLGLAAPTPLNIQCMYFEMGDVTVSKDTPYAFVIDAAATPDPTANWVSYNASTSTAAVARSSPHAAPTTVKAASGAIAWLDPRERVMWTHDQGATWRYGPDVGGGRLLTPSDFLQYEYTGWDVTGSTEKALSSFVRLPWMAWQTPADYAASPTLYHQDSYYQSYFQDGTFTLTCNGIPRSCVLTYAGALGNPTDPVGVITVTNLATGQTATTPRLAGGLQIAKLSQPITVTADATLGDNITISNDGVVSKNENDEPFKRLANLGATREWPFITTGQQTNGVQPDATDFAQMFVLDANREWPFVAPRQVARSAIRHA